jgi:polar amino acid transport system substrate-binding protein
MMHICLWLLALTIGPSARARDFDAIKASGTVKFATEGAFKPFNYFEGKKLEGFEVDLAEMLAKKLGLNIEWVTQPFESLLIGLGQDRYDAVIASHAITEERLKAVDFAAPHYCTGGMIVSHVDGPQTPADLVGKVVGVQIGTTHLANVDKIQGVKKVRTFPKDTDAFQALTLRRVDAWVTDRFVAMGILKDHPEAHLQLGTQLFEERVAIAIAKGNISLLNQLNSALSEIMKDGSYAKLSKKYFGQDVRCKK